MAPVSLNVEFSDETRGRALAPGRADLTLHCGNENAFPVAAISQAPQRTAVAICKFGERKGRAREGRRRREGGRHVLLDLRRFHGD